MRDKSKGSSGQDAPEQAQVAAPRVDPSAIVAAGLEAKDAEQTGDEAGGRIAVDAPLDPLAGSSISDVIGAVGDPPEGEDAGDFGLDIDPFVERARQAPVTGSLLDDANQTQAGPGRGADKSGVASGFFDTIKGWLGVDDSEKDLQSGYTVGVKDGEVTSNDKPLEPIGEIVSGGGATNVRTAEIEAAVAQANSGAGQQTGSGGGEFGGGGQSEGGESDKGSDENDIVKTEETADGTTYTYEDGTVVVVTESGVATIHPDGSMDVRYNDGRTEHYDPPPKDAGGGAGTPAEDYISPEEEMRLREEIGAMSPGAQKGGPTDSGDIDPVDEGDFYVEGGGELADHVKDKDYWVGQPSDDGEFEGGGRETDGSVVPGAGNVDGNIDFGEENDKGGGTPGLEERPVGGSAEQTEDTPEAPDPVVDIEQAVSRIDVDDLPPEELGDAEPMLLE